MSSIPLDHEHRVPSDAGTFQQSGGSLTKYQDVNL